MLKPPTWKTYLALFAGILAVSMGSILIRLAGEISPLTIAFYRLLGACLYLLPVAIPRVGLRRLRSISGTQALAGTFLAIHFASWIASLAFTSVALSVVLTNAAPILVAVASSYLFGERLRIYGWAGIGAAFLGTWMLFGSGLDASHLKGALLALGGAFGLAGYLLAGHQVRQRKSLLEYVLPCYAVGCLALLFPVLLSGAPLTGFSTRTWIYLALLGLIPQAIGHTAYNWALGFFPATVVAVLILGEPVVAPLLGWWILGEPVSTSILPAAGLILAGIVLVAGWGTRAPEDRLEKE